MATYSKTILFWGGLSLFRFSIAPAEAGEIDSQSLVLPKWTDWHSLSLTDLVSYCDNYMFP